MFRNKLTKPISVLITLSFLFSTVFSSPAAAQVFIPSASVYSTPYTTNALNQVTAVSVNGVALANYAFDPLNRLTTKNLLGGPAKSAVFGYDAADQLLSLENKTTAVISKHMYLYDKAGNRLRHDNQVGTAAVKTLNFAYNKIYELTTTTGAQAHTYAYDKVGNRTTADSVAYASNTLNQYTTVGGVALTYDKNGNMTGQGTRTYIYDAENRLRQVTNGTVIAGKYTYDGFNRRVSKEVGTAKTFFVHDGDMVIEERNAAGAILADYVNGPRIDEVLTMTRAAVTSYYFYDGLGSVRQITNAAGATIETYDYDIFGRPVAASTKGNPVMFTGRWFDIESGNYYYRARYYSPAIGKFLQRDPIGYYDSMNLYQYVGNSPINFIDPYGLFDYRQAFIEAGKGGISGAIGGAILGASSIPTPYTAGGGALIGGGLGIIGGFIKGGLSDSPVPGGKIVGGALGGAFQGAVAGPLGAGIGAGIGALGQIIPTRNSGSNAVDITNEAGVQGILGCLSGSDSGMLGCILGAGSGIISGAINEGINQCSQ